MSDQYNRPWTIFEAVGMFLLFIVLAIGALISIMQPIGY